MRCEIHRVGIAFLLICFLMGCEKNMEEMKSRRIVFDVVDGNTKGESLLTTSNIESMCVSAYEGALFSNSSIVGNFMDRALVRRIASSWVSDVDYYYPFDGTVSFFAYAPYVQDSNVCNFKNYSRGFHSLEYSPSENVSSQTDFCVAIPILNRTKESGVVQFQLQHVMSNIQISAALEGELPPGQTLYIDELTLEGFVKSKRLSTSGSSPFFIWSSDGSRDRNYSLKRVNNQLINSPITPHPDYVLLNGSGSKGMLFLLPQTLLGNEILTINFGWYDSGKKVMERDVSLRFPKGQWRPGEIVKYKVKLEINQFTLSVIDWEISTIKGGISK